MVVIDHSQSLRALEYVELGLLIKYNHHNYKKYKINYLDSQDIISTPHTYICIPPYMLYAVYHRGSRKKFLAPSKIFNSLTSFGIAKKISCRYGRKKP